MRIQQSSVLLDTDYKNILVKDFSRNYTGVDKLDKPENVVQIMNDVFRMNDRAEEFLYLICMTTKCKPISFFEISHGTCNTSPAGIREIMIRIMLCGAACIVITHNHPSGDPTPSQSDFEMTQRLQNACSLMEIGFCDHIIIGRDTYYSMRAERKI